MRAEEKTPNGILFSEEITSINGTSFILFPEDSHTSEDIKQAKKWLRNERDVVSIIVASEDDRDYLYKGEYFRHKDVRPLKWYEINQDEALIRRERKKGTSIDEFVNTYVLPMVEQVHADFLKQYGDKIYGK